MRLSEHHKHHVFDFSSPATAPSSASLMGVVGKRLFERSEFPIAAHQVEQRRKQAVGGVIYFGYFLLDKQKKVTRLEAKHNVGYLKIVVLTYPICSR